MKRMLSKGLALLLAMVLCLALGACGNNGTSQESQEPQVEPVVKMEDGTVLFNLTAEEFRTKFNETVENESEKIGNWKEMEENGSKTYGYDFGGWVYLFLDENPTNNKIQRIACSMYRFDSDYDTELFHKSVRSMFYAGAQTLDLDRCDEIISELHIKNTNNLTYETVKEGDFQFSSANSSLISRVEILPIEMSKGSGSGSSEELFQPEDFLLPISAAEFRAAFNSITSKTAINSWHTVDLDGDTGYTTDLGGIAVTLLEDENQKGLRFATCTLSWDEYDSDDQTFGEAFGATMYAACPDLTVDQLYEVLEGLKINSDVWSSKTHKEEFRIKGYCFSMSIDADTWSLMIYHLPSPTYQDEN